MKTSTPLGLKIIRILSIVILFFSLIGLLATFKGMLDRPEVLLLSVGAIIFYASLIIAINKQNKVLFRTVLVLSVIFSIISVFQFIVFQFKHIPVRIIIEILLFVYLWKNKSYFSK